MAQRVRRVERPAAGTALTLRLNRFVDSQVAAGRHQNASTDEELEALVAGIGERASARLKAKRSG